MSSRGHAADVAQQTESSQSILNQFLSQLIPGSQEYLQLQREGIDLVRRTADPGDQQDMIRQLSIPLVQQQFDRISAGGAATPEEARTDLSFRAYEKAAAFRPEEQDVFGALRGQGTSTPSGNVFADVVARAQNPDKYYQSTLAPQLQLAGEAVKARAAQRGILGSGLELENLGRTGAELAIQQAAAQDQYRQEQLGNFNNVYAQGQALRGREIGVSNDLVNLQLGREGHNLDILNSNTGQSLLNQTQLLQRNTTREQSLMDVANAAASRKQALLGGVLANTVLKGPIGGLQTLASSYGNQANPTAGQLQAAQQAGGQQQPSQQLSRQPQQVNQGAGGLNLNTLMKLLGYGVQGAFGQN